MAYPSQVLDYSDLLHDSQAHLESHDIPQELHPQSHLDTQDAQGSWHDADLEHLTFEPEEPEEDVDGVKDAGVDGPRHKRRGLNLTEDERSQRSRDQNRKAAAKSRNKRRNEL